MKWVTHKASSGSKVAVVSDGYVYDVNDDRPMLEIIRSGTEAMSSLASDALSTNVSARMLGEVALEAPLEPPI